MVRARFLLEDPGFGSPPAVDARQVPWHFSGHGQHLRPPFGYGAGTTTPLFPIARESLFFCSDGDRGFIAAVAPSRVVSERRNGASALPLGRPGVWFSPLPSMPVVRVGGRVAMPFYGFETDLSRSTVGARHRPTGLGGYRKVTTAALARVPADLLDGDRCGGGRPVPSLLSHAVFARL